MKTRDPFHITKSQQASLSPEGLRALDIRQAETPMRDHLARFWRYLETETVRVLVDMKRVVGHDAPDGPVTYWDSASFSDDVAKGLVAEKEQLREMAALSFQWMDAHDTILGFIQADPQRFKDYLAWEKKPVLPNPESTKTLAAAFGQQPGNGDT